MKKYKFNFVNIIFNMPTALFCNKKNISKNNSPSGYRGVEGGNTLHEIFYQEPFQLIVKLVVFNQIGRPVACCERLATPHFGNFVCEQCYVENNLQKRL